MSRLALERTTWIRIRMAILVAAMAAGALAVARGAWDLGVTRGPELRSLAEKQYTRRITLPARRGMITDRHGKELAIEVEVDSVYADGRRVEDPNQSAALLAPVLGQDEAALARKLAEKRPFSWLARQVTPEVAQKVHDLKIDGISLLKEGKRGYPARAMASQVIGFTGVDAEGLEGIELKYNEQLKGQQNAVLGLRDARGRVVFGGDVFGPGGIVGNTVELTIDKTLQYYAEQELANTVRVFEARAGHVIIMDPYNGEILAMASWPTYNPNAVSDSKPLDRRNRAVLDVVEPGSTFKVFTLAAALNSGAIRPDDLFFCEDGRMEIGETRKVYIHDDHQDGWLNTTQCLKRSSNICFAKIALKLGKDRLYQYIRRFGFGQKTDVDLPFESVGMLHHFKSWYDIDTATIAFGQGIGVTNLQIATALSAIANGGVLMRPRIARRVVGPDGRTVRTFAPEEKRRVLSRYTAKLVGDIMTSVTEEGGTGQEAALEGFLVAGKTGTAQKSEGAKGYSGGKWVASFIGFIPADRPRLTITVIIDEPQIYHYGGSVAAPALRRIADKSLRYLGIAPHPSAWRTEVAKASGRPAAPAGERSATPAEEAVPDGGLGPPVLGKDQIAAPNLEGMTMKEVIEALAVHGLRPLFMGTGFAVDQVPAPGDPVEIGGYVQVNFEPVPRPAESRERELFGPDDSALGREETPAPEREGAGAAKVSYER